MTRGRCGSLLPSPYDSFIRNTSSVLTGARESESKTGSSFVTGSRLREPIEGCKAKQVRRVVHSTTLPRVALCVGQALGHAQSTQGLKLGKSGGMASRPCRVSNPNSPQGLFFFGTARQSRSNTWAVRAELVRRRYPLRAGASRGLGWPHAVRMTRSFERSPMPLFYCGLKKPGNRVRHSPC